MYFTKKLIILACIAYTGALEIQKGSSVGCFKRSQHNVRASSRYIKNCFDHCESLFFRYAILDDTVCSCENIIFGIEEDKNKCDRNCTVNDDEILFCGGDDVESIYGTGSNLPGAVQNLIVNYTTEDKIVLVFDMPERNGTELTEYELRAVVLSTYSSNPWSMRNITRKVSKSLRKIEVTDLISSTEYNFTIVSKNGDSDGGSKSVVGKTRNSKPDKPEEPKILKHEGNLATIEINRAINNNGPITKYVIVVHYVDNELIHDFDENLLTTYQKAKDDGLSYYITGEIDPFREQSREFIIGDGKRYGIYYNAPLQENRHFHVLVGILSRVFDEEKVTYSNSSHEESHENIIMLTSLEDEGSDLIVILLTTACIICGLILVGSILFYGYIKTRINPRIRRFERHEMSGLQGPILEVDNNGYIADVSGINFKEKLQEVLLSLDDDQKIIRKNLSLDIDNILGIGSFGDVIRGQLNGNILCQVHVVSADDMDPPIQTKFIRDLNSLLQFGFHRNMLNFLGICQTHDWFFVVFEDTPMTLKQFLLTNRLETSLMSQRATNLQENEIIRLMYELAETIEYLQYNKVVHKNLNSYNVRVKRQNSAYTIKLSVFGPTLYNVGEDGSKNMVDEERWFAPEVIRFQKYSHASDIYSFGLVAWEMCCLGGTIYGSVATNDLLARIKKGFRPDKHPFVSEDLYQLMLNCWELDPLERSEIGDITSLVKQMQTSPMHYLNYNYDGQLPYYLPLLEIKN